MNDPTNKRRRPMARHDRDLLHVTAYGPDELTANPLEDLLSRWQASRAELAAMDRETWRTTPRAGAVALLAVVASATLGDALLERRWLDARDALAAGAEIRTLAKSMGLDEDEVVVGLRSWAERGLAAGELDQAVVDDVAALLAEGGA